MTTTKKNYVNKSDLTLSNKSGIITRVFNEIICVIFTSYGLIREIMPMTCYVYNKK